jgi:hypothetical protein
MFLAYSRATYKKKLVISQQITITIKHILSLSHPASTILDDLDPRLRITRPLWENSDRLSEPEHVKRAREQLLVVLCPSVDGDVARVDEDCAGDWVLEQAVFSPAAC